MTKPINAAVIISACLGASLGISAVAQTSAKAPKSQPIYVSTNEGIIAPATERSHAPQVAQAPQSPPAQPKINEDMPPAGPPPSQAQGAQDDDSSHPAPLLWVSSVEAMRSTHGPQLDIIRVRGLSSTEGWEGAELVPLAKGPSADGMLDLAFIAQSPADTTAPTSFPEIEAVFVIEPGHPYKGVRVHGATNRVTLKAIPGYAESAPQPNDCHDCVGKFFVGKGENLPAGAHDVDVVREETLPKALHVVKGTEGIGKLDSDPNRLTLVLGDDGRIVIAVWD